MTNLTKFMGNEIEPFDLLFRNFFDRDTFFAPATQSNFNYPVDIHETEESLNIDIAIPGIDKENINIEECEGVLNVSYDKTEDYSQEDKKHWIKRGITRKSFNMGWKISDKFDLKKIEAEMDKGLLQIKIPRAVEKTQVKKLIKIK